MTPLTELIYLKTCQLTEHARILTSGLYFETNLANFPESVKTIIK